MNSTLRSLLVAGLALALCAPLANAGEAAEADIEILKDAIRANRRALVAANMRLTDEEAEKFWPAYDRYQKEMNAIQDRVVKLIGDYAESMESMTDERGLEITKAYLDLESERAKVRQDHLDAIARTLPGKKVARFYQIENKMDAIMRYEAARVIPVVKE